ncbi:MAG: YggS family pyridoxal phosphate-dependent enzyme [Micavibrio sp.]
MPQQIADNLIALKKKTGNAILVAVSKQQPDARIDAALLAGQRVFGENRVQEAGERWTHRRAVYPDLSLHLIGPLQTNKVAEAVALFDVIETIDRIKLADALKAEMDKQGKTLNCFIQVNTGGEDQKAGVSLSEFPALLAHCRKVGLNVDGLMCIPPVDEPPALHFALLKKLAAEWDLKNLSMGMSGDFEKAVMLGATHVRIGSAVFGARDS